MKVHLWGTDFRRSPAEMRAKLCFSPESRESIHASLLSLGFKDLVYLSTCNRIELYTTAPDHFCDTRQLWLKALHLLGLEEDDFYRGYHLEGKSALRHLLRVAASLESMVIGEPQILGQLKEALSWTSEKGFPVEPSLERSFQLAFQTAKKIRTTTGIGEKSVSVGSLGLEKVQAAESEIPLERAVIVGRSPISVLVAQWLQKERPDCSILWVNRTVDALETLPEAKNTQWMSLKEFLNSPPHFSHLFTATASLDPIFDQQFFMKLDRDHKMILDFAQPPDVERADAPEFLKLVQLIDLEETARKNRLERKRAIDEAEKLIELAIRDYCIEQKEAPVLRDFGRFEPEFFDNMESLLAVLEQEFPAEMQPRLRKWAQKLVKKNLHQSREHLRLVLRQVSEPDRAMQIIEG